MRHHTILSWPPSAIAYAHEVVVARLALDLRIHDPLTGCDHRHKLFYNAKYNLERAELASDTKLSHPKLP